MRYVDRKSLSARLTMVIAALEQRQSARFSSLETASFGVANA
jgi:hypothetical protein